MKKTLSIKIDPNRKAPEPKVMDIMVHDLSRVRVEIPVKRKFSPAMEAALKTVAGMQ